MNFQTGSIEQSVKNVFRGLNDELQNCIQSCNVCHQVCLHVIQNCLQKGGAHAEPSHIRLLQDCAEICETSADFMIRGSDLHASTCRACAEVCLACAADCDRFTDDEMMKNCADVCRQCAESCQDMASGH